MKFSRPATWFGIGLVLVVSGGLTIAASGDQLAGIVQSVDLAGKKIVVTPTGQETTYDVLVNDQTEFATEGGNPFQFKDLKPGDGLGIALNAGVASKVLVAVKPGELTGHVKSIKAEANSFVVTETGTTTDVTVKITEGTSIVDVKGKKLELKELKKGDGVGLCHFNSVATKVVVNAKPSVN
jgi:hypothetical protein